VVVWSGILLQMATDPAQSTQASGTSHVRRSFGGHDLYPLPSSQPRRDIGLRRAQALHQTAYQWNLPAGMLT
jgi:hypothetical protein